MYFLLVIKKEKKPIKNKERERRNFVLLEANYWIQEMFGNKNCQDPCERIEVIMRMKNSLIQIFNFVHESIFL